MTTSPTPLLFEILRGDPIPAGKMAYFEQLQRNELHEMILEEFLRQERAHRLTRRKLAERISKKPEQITRWLAAPGNWTLDTVSNLLLGMRAKLKFAIVGLAEDQAAAPAREAEWTGNRGVPDPQGSSLIPTQPSATSFSPSIQIAALLQSIATSPQPLRPHTGTDIPAKILEQKEMTQPPRTRLLGELAA